MSDDLRKAAENLMPFIWESNFDEEVETEYERAVVALRDALAAAAPKPAPAPDLFPGHAHADALAMKPHFVPLPPEQVKANEKETAALSSRPAPACGEYTKAIALANRVLDRPSGDPDDDLAVLARQFLRTNGLI